MLKSYTLLTGERKDKELEVIDLVLEKSYALLTGEQRRKELEEMRLSIEG